MKKTGVGKLKFKGEKCKKPKPQHSLIKKLDSQQMESQKNSIISWNIVDSLKSLTGHVVLTAPQGEDKLFVLCSEKDGSVSIKSGVRAEFAPESISVVFTVNSVVEGFISIKNAFGKYLSARRDNSVSCDNKAVGACELWKVENENGHFSLKSSFDSYLSLSKNDDQISFLSNDPLKLLIFVRHEKFFSGGYVVGEDELPLDRDDLKDIELKMLEKTGIHKVAKKSQSSLLDESVLSEAKEKGTFYETLVERRSKMKRDKFC